jgi:hypothetical protein
MRSFGLLLLLSTQSIAADAGDVQKAIVQACGCQVIGVSVGIKTDRSTWKVVYDPSATPTQVALGNAALAAFDPTALINNPVYVPTTVMLGRLTDAEYTAIMQAASANLAKGDGQLSRWLDMARTDVTHGVNLNSPATMAAKASLIAAGLLTQARADVVFAP